jgi:hypothetical protein
MMTWTILLFRNEHQQKKVPNGMDKTQVTAKSRAVMPNPCSRYRVISAKVHN